MKYLNQQFINRLLCLLILTGCYKTEFKVYSNSSVPFRFTYPGEWKIVETKDPNIAVKIVSKEMIDNSQPAGLVQAMYLKNIPEWPVLQNENSRSNYLVKFNELIISSAKADPKNELSDIQVCSNFFIESKGFPPNLISVFEYKIKVQSTTAYLVEGTLVQGRNFYRIICSTRESLEDSYRERFLTLIKSVDVQRR